MNIKIKKKKIRENHYFPSLLFFYREFPFWTSPFICQSIFKIFVAHFTTNLVLNIIKKIFCLFLN